MKNIYLGYALFLCSIGIAQAQQPTIPPQCQGIVKSYNQHANNPYPWCQDQIQHGRYSDMFSCEQNLSIDKGYQNFLESIKIKAQECIAKSKANTQ